MKHKKRDPIFDTDTVADAREILQNGERNWDYLDGEERYGTVVEALQLLEEVL
ncbi:hypothetical protein HUG10_20700 (plasmid) [Halorarum halophilum]|uniref:Uncharacterized protein n=1 Tax=Halorarum halophilum TaxID=2743090 RepID=A0A7D5GHQ1_9EURY|nr:hypothetical protein [Halobaculum halophilum]QLG30028.1 hypothetical protein HUG10_20700 [Halobaculum halophilum]